MVSASILAGASGYAFKEWKGAFYPDDVKADDMLAFYAERLPTVEINNTFYRMPQAEVLANWAAATPAHFRFAIKASRRITHITRLKAEGRPSRSVTCTETWIRLATSAVPVLFQLPPNLKKDLPRLEAFIAHLPADHGAAFEFRNDSWFDDEVYAMLRAAGAALCLSEREDNAPPPLVETASWGYLRLRLETYSDADLGRWVERVRATSWQTTHAYFMHEPTAPGYAASLLAIAESERALVSSRRPCHHRRHRSWRPTPGNEPCPNPPHARPPDQAPPTTRWPLSSTMAPSSR